MSGIQAGGSAGRLSIEIVAEVARLQSDMDKVRRLVRDASGDIAKNAKAANDNLAGVGRGSGAGIAEFSREVARLKGGLDPAWAAMQRYKDQVRLLQQALREGAISHRVFVDQMRDAVSTLKAAQKPADDLANGVQRASGAGRAFAMQMSQVGQQVMAGTGAVQALAMQLPDIAVGFAGAGAGAGRFVSFLGGPLGIALTTVIGLMASFAASSDKAGEASDKQKGSVDDLRKSIAELDAATRKSMQSTYASIQATLDEANAARLTTIEKRKQAIAELELQKAKRSGATASADANPYGNNILSRSMAASADSEVSALDKKIKDLTHDIGLSNRAIRLLGGQRIKLQVGEEFDKSAAAAGKFGRTLDKLDAQLGSGAITYTQYQAAVRAATSAREAEEAAGKKSHETKDKVTKAEREAAKAAREMMSVLKEIVGAYDPARKAAEDYAEALAKIDQLSSAGKISGSDAISYKIEAARKAAAEQAALEKQKLSERLGYEIGGANDPIGKTIDGMLEAQDQVRKYEFETQQALKTASDAVRDHAQTWNSLGSALDQISPGLGDVVALLKGLETGDFTSMRGKIGGALSLIKMGTGDKGWEKITAKLDTIFGGSGSFSKTMTGLMRGAGIGSASSQLLGGSGGLGSMIGGALGEKLGEKFLSKGFESIAKGLGDFAGPLGAIAGGVLGDLLGGVFKGKPAIGATVIDSVDGANFTWGRKGADQNTAAVGGGVQEALGQIITALGAVAGSFKVSIGNVEWNGQNWYRVSQSGRSDVGDKPYVDSGAAIGDMIYDGTDAAEAMRVAIMNAIEDGAIKGISDTELRLLKSGTDLQASLTKVMTFRGVFDDLKKATDPTGFALDQLTAKFDALRLTFTEAGASADEMGKLEQLLAIQRKDIMDEAAKKELDALNERRAVQVKLLEAQGKDAEALALAREIELSGTADALKDLQKQVYAAQDAQEAAKAAEQLSDAWKSVGDSITEEIRRIRGLTDAGTSKGFVALQGEFNAALAAARAGDVDTAKLLPGLSKDLLDAAALVATSRRELDRVRAQTASALESLLAVEPASPSADAAALLTAAAATQATATASPANDDLLTELRSLREEVAQLRKENSAGHAATAGSAGKAARILEDVTAPNGGQAITVAGVAA